MKKRYQLCLRSLHKWSKLLCLLLEMDSKTVLCSKRSSLDLDIFSNFVCSSWNWLDEIWPQREHEKPSKPSSPMQALEPPLQDLFNPTTIQNIISLVKLKELHHLLLPCAVLVTNINFYYESKFIVFSVSQHFQSRKVATYVRYLH